MGLLRTWSSERIRRLIEESNQRSAEGSQKYVVWENNAIRRDYEFIQCTCPERCWCRRNGCNGHYRIKNIPFDQFLDTYVTLWTPPRARNAVRKAVLEGTALETRQRHAKKPLQVLRDNWPDILAHARTYDKCGLCDCAEPPISSVLDLYQGSELNLYQGKICSQLFYDSIAPFDTASRLRMKRAGYPDPKKDFAGMNGEIFRDLRALSAAHGLDVSDIRNLDSPRAVLPGLPAPERGQPLSRVVDKIFYNPNAL